MSYDLAAVWGVAAAPLALTGAVLLICLAGLWLSWCRRVDATLAEHAGRLARLEERTGDGD